MYSLWSVITIPSSSTTLTTSSIKWRIVNSQHLVLSVPHLFSTRNRANSHSHHFWPWWDHHLSSIHRYIFFAFPAVSTQEASNHFSITSSRFMIRKLVFRSLYRFVSNWIWYFPVKSIPYLHPWLGLAWLVSEWFDLLSAIHIIESETLIPTDRSSSNQLKN